MSASCPYCSQPLTQVSPQCPSCGARLLGEGDAADAAPAEGAAASAGAAAAAPPAVAAGPADGDPAAEYELGRLLGWVVKDPEWIVKVLIGAACLLGGFLLLPTFALLGYKLRVARQQRERPGELPMPDWGGFGELLVDGLKLWIAMALPGLTLFGVVGGCLASGFLLVAAASGGQGEPPPELAAGAGLLVIGAWATLIVGALAMTYLMPAIELEYLETGSVLSGLRVGALWRRVVGDPVEYLVVFAYHYIVQMIGTMGMFACYIGMFVSLPWALYTDGALLGRYLAKQDQARAEA